jgi:Excalibur calcium-binding domain
LLPALLLAKAKEYFQGKGQSKGNPQAGDQKGIDLDSDKQGSTLTRLKWVLIAMAQSDQGGCLMVGIVAFIAFWAGRITAPEKVVQSYAPSSLYSAPVAPEPVVEGEPEPEYTPPIPVPAPRYDPPAYYANCSAARAAGAAPVYAGEAGYARRLDRDNDGVGCE